MPDRNLLDELMKLLNQPGGVNWALAGQLADHLSGSPEPIDPWLADEYLDLARLAQLRVSQEIGMATDPLAEVVLVDAVGWSQHHLKSFGYLVEPLADRLAESLSGPFDAMLKPLGPAMLGLNMGALVGTMSKGVLGLFDAGLPTMEPRGLTFHVPNIEAFAALEGLDHRQVRLWSAFHEVVHETLMARSWVRRYLAGLLEDMIASIEPNPEIMGIFREAMADPARLEETLAAGDLFGNLLGDSRRHDHSESLQSFMTTVEGYGAYLVGQAAGVLLPDLASIQRSVLSWHLDHFHQPNFAGLPGFDSTAGSHGDGAVFCEQVAERWGPQAADRVWYHQSNLPSLAELKDVTGWAARVLLDDPL